MFFPYLESALLRKAPHQNLLFDNDDTTCLDAHDKFAVNGQPVSLIVYWDPNEKNSPRDDVATYYCQTEFFVNVTSTENVDVLVLKRSGVFTRYDDGTTEYQQCPLIGRSTVQGMVRSKFKCQCVTKCHVIINFAFSNLTENDSNSRICTLKVYD